MNEPWRRVWARSKTFRALLALAVLYALARLVVQGVYLAGKLPGQPDGYPVPVDLQVYLDAATHYWTGQDIYLQENLTSIEYHLPYPPSYAMAFGLFLWLPPRMVAVVHTLLHVAAYGLLYGWWHRIFRRLGLSQAREMLVWTLPVWLVYVAFWSDLGYLNIYIPLALAATLLLDAALHERLGWAVLWLSLILQTKPMWAFAAAVPLFLGRWRFFWRLILLCAVCYVAVTATTILVAGPEYGLQQYLDYVRLLPRLTREFPWRGPDAPFLGYNHSIKQVLIYLFGLSTAVMRTATAVKALILAPLAVIGLRCLRHPAERPGHQVPRLALNLAFALYLGAFAWLDIVWELSLGIAVFTYLLAECKSRAWRTGLWLVFMPYALVDVWQIASYAVLGPDVVLPGPYVLTDPSVHLPLIMIVILTLYAVSVWRLWGATRLRQPAGVQ